MKHIAAAPLRIANEAFLVASLIERCPKTMMLRELVTNAVEAASGAAAGERRVCIGSTLVGGVSKLRIWNTGPGLTPPELYVICDLASSLHKVTGLNANFGMGAKVASLPSNREGLRYRSSCGGRVSQVMLGFRNGIYCRIGHAGIPAVGQPQVEDVTDLCRQQGDILAFDWTEVVLLGNVASQDTVLDPYAGDPRVARDWVHAYLSARYWAIPAGIAVDLDTATRTPLPFLPVSARFNEFDRSETVELSCGIKLHYGYDRPDGEATASAGRPFGPMGGRAGLVYRDEIYTIRQGQDWLAEAPAFGIPFASRYCSVFVELPPKAEVLPEAYRQFLRHRNGDQHQVMLGEFAASVRRAMPGWLKSIVQSFGPAAPNYAAEIRAELQALLLRLGIVLSLRPDTEASTKPEPPKQEAPAEPAKVSDQEPPVQQEDEQSPAPEDRAPPAPPPSGHVPPEIISLKDEALIDERGLQNRVARYYPVTHQLFVNLGYPSVPRMTAQLRQEYASAPDPDRVASLAEEIAEWAITRRVARALVFGLGKERANWDHDAVTRGQSAESLSIVADDHDAAMPEARQRMAAALGLDDGAAVIPAAPNQAALEEQRQAGELSEARQAARRALATNAVNPGPLLRRLSDIETRRNDTEAAISWMRRAVAADPADPWSHFHLAGLLIRQGDLTAAQEATLAALERSPLQRGPMLRRLSEISTQGNDPATARRWAEQALAEAPLEAGTYDFMAGLLLREGEIEGAKRHALHGLTLSPPSRAPLLRRLSEVALAEGSTEEAERQAIIAIEDSPADPWSRLYYSQLLLRTNRLDEAETAARDALQLIDQPGERAPVFQRLSEVAAKRNDHDAALHWLRQAVVTDGSNPWTQSSLSGLLLKAGELDGAERAARAALALMPGRPGGALRRLSEIASRRNEPELAMALAQQAIEAQPADPWSREFLGGLLLQRGHVANAEEQFRLALSLSPAEKAPFLRRLAELKRQAGDTSAALSLAEQAVAADGSDLWGRLALFNLLLSVNSMERAELELAMAMQLVPEPTPGMLRAASELARRRGDNKGAVDLAHRAIAADEADPWSHFHLSGLLLSAGDLEGAEAAARRALQMGPDRPEVIEKRVSEIVVRQQAAA